MTPPDVEVGSFKIGRGQPLALLAGPCIIESTEHCLMVADKVAGICKRLGIHYVFKCSFDKANRTSASGFRGPGIEEGLRTLAEVKKRIGVPIVTDIHTADQAAPTAEWPTFCRSRHSFAGRPTSSSPPRERTGP